MGSSKSKETSIDSTGLINNNIMVEDHVQITNKTALTLIYILIGLRVFEILYIVYRDHRRSIQKVAKRKGNNAQS